MVIIINAWKLYSEAIVINGLGSNCSVFFGDEYLRPYYMVEDEYKGRISIYNHLTFAAFNSYRWVRIIYPVAPKTTPAISDATFISVWNCYSGSYLAVLLYSKAVLYQFMIFFSSSYWYDFCSHNTSLSNIAKSSIWY